RARNLARGERANSEPPRVLVKFNIAPRMGCEDTIAVTSGSESPNSQPRKLMKRREPLFERRTRYCSEKRILRSSRQRPTYPSRQARLSTPGLQSGVEPQRDSLH